MNEKKIFFGFASLVVLFVFFVGATSIRLEQSQQTIGRLRNELENAGANERILEQQIATAEQTITSSRESVERLTTITRESAEQFARGQSTIDGLRKSIKEAEEFYTNLENELNSLRNKLGDSNSDLEVE